MDLTSRPGTKWDPTARHIQQSRIHLAASADLLRMEGRLLKAEALYRQATRYADGGAFDHLVRLADHCRTTYEKNKAKKARAEARRKKGAR